VLLHLHLRLCVRNGCIFQEHIIENVNQSVVFCDTYGLLVLGYLGRMRLVYSMV
jgi:hypothetical protein